MGASLPALLRRPAILWIALAAALVAASVIALLVVPRSDADEASYRDPALPVAERVEDLLGRMTIEEKVGQMTQAAVPAVEDTPADIAELGIGSLLNGGSDALHDTPEDWAAMIDGFQRRALDSRLGIPLVYGIDAVHGNGALPGAVIFPHNIGLGAAHDPELAGRTAAITAAETRATGVHWTFAPCVCVARDSRWGRTYESYGEDPGLAIEYAGPVVRGFQGEDLAANTSVLATAKHYVGDGGTAYGTSTTEDYLLDQGVTTLTEDELRQLHLAPFQSAVDAGVGSVMVSYSSTDLGDGPVKAHADGYLLNDVLKGELGFDGFVVSDWQGVDQIGDDYAEAVRTAINAGIDMVMVPFEYERFITTLLAEIESGAVSEDRIDDAVARILTQKFALGLFERPLADTTGAADVGSEAHRAVAREAVAASQVLLRNENDLLPLTGDERLYVAGSGADSLGRQMGGWSGSWQGTVESVHDGTTLLAGIQETAASVTYSEKATEPLEGADVGIVVVAEDPYAEGVGDAGAGKHDMRVSEADAAAIDHVCGAVDCAVIVVSGRPIEIESHLDGVDALVAAWLPGSEGAGVADPLFGRTAYDGRLPVSWPRVLEDEPLNVGDPDYDPLFPFGLGLRTEATG
ncbi:glycoside hydrolase family 3 C-terminal domain-containing protein [Glycomyces sp. TRM65418]|uniref:glycoside hydrolase family 3 protein n=1 Tax=Glycomyces sp. TRM65418 TaxID=2867006 RepID=UPI001CE59C20|nr:glycoside hydrolase family 3 N-terminal domain-containing protein [Glycomyces sp. TRM65418]MCC3765036.1 glycoside hydrolase family 3 C-terminal domain-containing protein [Glycomyces sp. TRM65418]QZD54665.1 glycoside hydrolase family 3 C-terminal domain-containing protein [Glycomyces sp. TRM65418]